MPPTPRTGSQRHAAMQEPRISRQHSVGVVFDMLLTLHDMNAQHARILAADHARCIWV